MFGLIFGIIILIVGVIIGIYIRVTFKNKPIYKTVDRYGTLAHDEHGEKIILGYENNPKRKFAPVVIIASIVLCISFIVGGMVAKVPTGHTGVVTVFGKVKAETLDSGIHVIAPWENVVNMDNRVQKETTELSCFSKDIQEVRVSYTLNFQINKANASQIYKTIGKDYYTITIAPAIAESVKVVVARYTAEELIGTREVLASTIENDLKEQLTKFNIELVSTSIEDMDFTDSFTNAVEAKQVADQKAKQAKIEQEQAKMEAEYKKEIAEIEANASAEVAKIQAQADMEVAKIGADSAEYQGKKDASIKLQALAGINGWTVVLDETTSINKLYKADGSEVTAAELAAGVENLIKYYYTENWNGILPETYVGDSAASTIILGK